MKNSKLVFRQGYGWRDTNLVTATDPGFVNKAGYDYHLTSGSAAIAASERPQPRQ